MRNWTQPRMIALSMVLFAACVPLAGGGDGGGDNDMGTGTVQPKLSSLYSAYLSRCSNCHAPGAPGRTTETEKSLDFSTVATAHATLSTGKATGLVGNQAPCNGVPFIVAGQPGKSLVVAALDQPTRQVFDDPQFPGCDEAVISDMTVKVGMPNPTPTFIAALKQWITDGAQNN